MLQSKPCLPLGFSVTAQQRKGHCWRARSHCRSRPPVTTHHPLCQAAWTHFDSPTPSAGLLSWVAHFFEHHPPSPLLRPPSLLILFPISLPCRQSPPHPPSYRPRLKPCRRSLVSRTFLLFSLRPFPRNPLSSSNLHNGGETQQDEPGAGDAGCLSASERIFRASRWHRPRSHHIRHLQIFGERRISTAWHL